MLVELPVGRCVTVISPHIKALFLFIFALSNLHVTVRWLLTLLGCPDLSVAYLRSAGPEKTDTISY